MRVIIYLKADNAALRNNKITDRVFIASMFLSNFLICAELKDSCVTFDIGDFKLQYNKRRKAFDPIMIAHVYGHQVSDEGEGTSI
jgi:hypothetical protein